MIHLAVVRHHKVLRFLPDKLVGLNVFCFFFPGTCLGATVGFVCVSQFLSMFVELGVQTSLTIRDVHWVGNWWLGFAIFGAICVFWSIWLIGFPKEFPLTEKQRKTKLCEDITVS